MKLKLSILALVICTLVSAQGKKKAPRSSKKGRGNLPTNFWVKKTSKSRKLYAQSIKCDVGGTLTLNMGKTMGKTITSKVTAGRYVRVGTPKTAAIKAIDTAMNSGKWAAVISKSTAYLSKNAWLGWGGYVGYMKGKAQLAKKDIVGAERTFKAAEKYAKVGKPAYYAKIKRGSIEALLANKKYDAAEKKLKKVRRTPENRPFIYVTKGKVLE
ncbi:MAG: hypothetical protein HRT89_18805, partial [Lentisphaeria bacterium]|nr:hypothetical protein [Lentisphaeria bacterium]